MTRTYIDTLDTPRVDPEVVSTLAGQLSRSVLIPGEPAYEEARRLWNGMIDRQPALIARPAHVDDIRRAVHFAQEHDLPLSIKGEATTSPGSLSPTAA